METLEEKHTKMPTDLPDIFTAFFFAYLSLCVCVVCGVWLCVHVLYVVLYVCVLCGVWVCIHMSCVMSGCACLYTGACTVLVIFNCQLELI